MKIHRFGLHLIEARFLELNLVKETEIAMAPRKYRPIKTIHDLQKHIARSRRRQGGLVRKALRRQQVCIRAHAAQMLQLQALSACNDYNARMALFKALPPYFSDLLRIDDELKTERQRLAQRARGQRLKLQPMGELGTRVALIERLAVGPENLDRRLVALWDALWDELVELGFDPKLEKHPTDLRKYKYSWHVDGRLEQVIFGRFCTIASAARMAKKKSARADRGY
jgi:hypothetical protein